MKIEFKHVLTYAIGPALIAGFFTVAPKLYEIFFESKAELRYTYSAGPQIGVDGIQQQVASIKVSNTGRKTLAAIRVEVSIPSGSFAAATVENSSGLVIEPKRIDEKLVVNVPKFFQGETFSISTLIKTETEKINPKIFVRSDEVLGIFEETKVGKFDWSTSLISSGLSAFSVLIMALVGLSRIGKGGPFGYSGDKRDSIFYIASSTKCPPLIDAVRRAGEDITYMNFADILFSFGRGDDGSVQGFSVAGLQCIVDIDTKNIADNSKRVAVRNLELLLGNPLQPDQLNSVVSVDDPLLFRDHVDSVFSRYKKLF